MKIAYGEFLFIIDDSDPFKVHVSLMLAANQLNYYGSVAWTLYGRMIRFDRLPT